MTERRSDESRQRMVEAQIVSRGVTDPAVIAAMLRVPREAFLPPEMAEFAFQDSALPIEEGQTISQPYIVAAMAEALGLNPSDRVLEVGTGSGYAAAVLASIASEVYTVERHGALAASARDRLQALGYDNVHVRHGDGSLGWPEHAPYDAIVVAAGGPEIPPALRDQLAPHGRLVIPVGPTPRMQHLVRLRRTNGAFERERLRAVTFVPLIGAGGWEAEGAPETIRPSAAHSASRLVRETCEPLAGIDEVPLGSTLERIGDARIVLLGEASHGTSEFYRMRARISRELIERHGFNVVAVEADWPDAVRINDYVHDRPRIDHGHEPFTRFPTWMWRNHEVSEFAAWLRSYNGEQDEPRRRASFHGLDLFSLYTSIAAVLHYLDDVDPEAAQIARRRYGCLTPWQADPGTYGRAALSGRFETCEAEVVSMLSDMLTRRIDYSARDGERFLDAAQNARLIVNAELYYRIMYYGSAESWNLRDRHMFDTLQTLLAFYGPDCKAIVWAHNSHIGNAAATEMAARGEFNIGQLCRQEFGPDVYLIGFGTHAGTVAAAPEWGAEMEVMDVRPSYPESYERLFHDTEMDAFILHLREPARPEVREELGGARLERAIGVIYRPETELLSHYFQAILPRQFDEYIWFDRTEAVTPIRTPAAAGVPDTYPFGV